MDLRDLFKQININSKRDSVDDEEFEEEEEESLNGHNEPVAEIELKDLNIPASYLELKDNIDIHSVQGPDKPISNYSFSSLKASSNLEKSIERSILKSGSLSSLLGEDGDSEEKNLIIPTKQENFFAPPSGMKDVNLSPVSIQDLMLKFLFYQSSSSGKDLAKRARLPLHSIIDPMLMKLAEEKFVEVTGSSGLGGFNKTYRLTSAGYKRAEDVLKVSTYVGPAPVSLNDYIKAVNEEYGALHITEESLKDAYRDLVMDNRAFEQIGPAISSGKSMFLYGPPGTGKTCIAERITKCYKDTIKVPYAISVQGVPIRFFDYFLHTPVDPSIEPGMMPPIDPMQDARWIEIKRPCIIVGPEFTIASSDLQSDPGGLGFQFPSTIKANGGVFVIDDFGRQKENPETLLNRWIIPLDRQRDILNFPKTGQQISVPFKVFTVFSTNLDPKQLVDDAFLRRLAYKLQINFPSLEVYCQIFANEADRLNVTWSDELLDYFIQTHYFKAQRPLRACDPRDILGRVVDICRFKQLKSPYTLDKDLIDRGCRSYFVGSDKA